MNVKNDKLLVNKYPKIFKDRYGVDIKSTLMGFGFDCDNGWYTIIDELCGTIQTYIDETPNVEQVIAVQVKEKFGGLSFYYKGGDKYVRDIVNKISGLSYKTCEKCGSNDDIKQTKGWVKTLCGECYKKHNSKRILN